MSKKFGVKKAVLLIILVLIIGGIGFIVNAFKGNPISKYLAKNEYKKYVQETYPDTDFEVNKEMYDFKNGKYNAQVSSKDKKLKFRLDKRYDDVIKDEYRDSAKLMDYTVGRRFKDEIINETMKEITEVNNINCVKDIFVEMSFPQDKYDEDTKFTKDLNEKFKIQINLSRGSIKDKEVGKVVAVSDEEFINITYKIKEIIINMGYTGLTEIGFQFVDSNYNYEYILLTKEEFNTPKEDLINFKKSELSIYDKGGDEEALLRLREEIRLTLQSIKNIENIDVYKNIFDGNGENTEVSIRILKEVKPTKEELAKETFNSKELIKAQYPEIKYLNIDFYEYGELNAKDGNWGQYYGSIFIGNEFAPWKISEEEVNIKLKTWDKL